ncbi:MAG TPA: glycosyltransferase family 4 protein [Pyrinomonadaceae bacterium]|nr:glycosyltransferase family 4 protein [Pyrinomonadaceae bacterium]
MSQTEERTVGSWSDARRAAPHDSVREPPHDFARADSPNSVRSVTSDAARRTARDGASESARKPLRVLVVAPSHDILGGQSIHAAQLVSELNKEESFEVGFVPINPRAPGVLGRLQRVKYLRTCVRFPLYVWKLLANVPRCDVLHVSSAALSSFLVTTTPAVLVGRLFRRKVVLNYHAGQAEEHLRDWRRTALPVIRMADATVVSSGWLVDVFARYGLPARAIFNHVELDEFRFRQRRPLRPVFLSNRNFDPIYNVPCVLRAFAIIQKRFPEARLVVAGDGPQRGEIETLARELNLRGVEFKGRVAPGEMPALCDAADIYLNASNVDNMPLSILEAFASGLPVVTTNAGGIPYVVEHERTGLVVEMNDCASLASGALRLLGDEEFASRLARSARAECDKYKWAAVRGQWVEFYNEVAGREAAASD